MAVIYVDRVFLLNALVDYMLLLSAARLAGRPLRRKRFLLCAAMGGLYAVAVFGIPWLASPIIKLLSGVTMSGLAYVREPRPLRQMALFFLLSGGLAGMLLGFGWAAGSPTAYLNRLQYAQISWPVLLLSTAVFAVMLHIVLHQGARHGGGEVMDMTISINGCTQKLRALHDTGNTLRDPIGGNPVLVLEQQALKELFSPQLWAY